MNVAGVAMLYFEVMSQHFAGRTDENHEISQVIDLVAKHLIT